MILNSYCIKSLDFMKEMIDIKDKEEAEKYNKKLVSSNRL